MKEYSCIECQTIYDEKTVPQDFVCKKGDCPGEGLTGLCILRETSSTSSITPSPNENNLGNENNSSTPAKPARECGLCVLLMDASGSMFQDDAFKNVPLPSQYGKTFCSKAELVSKAAAQGIFELRQMTKADNAYICVIKFDTRQALVFNDTVENIIATHHTPTRLAKFLYEELGEFGLGTDINSALKMGAAYIKKFIAGQVPGMDDFTPLYHQQYIAKDNTWIDIPNVRLMLYTDGEQLTDFGLIKNPFQEETIDLLMGAYVGSPTDKGCKDLQAIIGNCPIHGEQQFTLLDHPTKIASLRGFFRMASGASGFCPKCLSGQSILLR